MSLGRSKAEQRGTVKYKGREYVNMMICAQRLGIAYQTLQKSTNKGTYTRQPLEGYSGLWYDWQQTRAIFNRQRRKQDHVRGGRRQKRDGAVFGPSSPISPVVDVPVPTVGTPGGVEVKDVDIPKDVDNILSYFDPEDPNNADCWETDDNGQFLYIPNTNPPRHYVDWKKAQDKGMANIRYQQYQKQRGELIPKADVIQMLSKVFPPVTAVIMQMPDKYASRINGRVEEMIGRPMTNEEVTIIKSILSDEAERICHNLQDAVEKVSEDAE